MTEHHIEYIDANTSYCHTCERTLPNAHAAYHSNMAEREGQTDDGLIIEDIQTSDSDDHHVKGYISRHFDNTVEIWCPSIDETKVVLGHEYVNNCPMCGDEIEFESIYF